MPSPRARGFGRSWTGAVAALGIVLLAPAANAQANYRNAPIGGRSQLLGGTGMTYGRDATAAFLNPATAVLVDDERLSFSVNFYTISLMYAPRWYVPGPVDRSKFGQLRIDNSTMTDLEFNALPSSLCFYFLGRDISFLVPTEKDPRTRNAHIGLCLATIQNQTFDYAAEGFGQTRLPSVTRQAQTLSQRYTRFSAGPTYAMHVSNALAIGASLHGSLATHRSLLAATATTYGSSENPIGSIFYNASRGDSFQLEATVGATLRFGAQTVGISVKSPSMHVYGVGGFNRQFHYDGAGSQTSTISAQGSFISHSPLRIGLGTGFEGRWGLFELDATFHAPSTAYSAELEGQTTNTSGGAVSDVAQKFNFSAKANGVANLAVGLELFMSPRLSVLTGASTDLSAVPNGTLARSGYFNYFPYRTQRVALSMGVSSHGEGGELMFGGELSAGWGERLAVNSYQLPPQIGTTGHGTYQLMFVVAGSTTLANLKRAVEDVKGVVKSPTPLPSISPNKPELGPTYNPRELDKKKR